MRKIELTRGKITLVDDNDFDKIKNHKWYFDGRYAQTMLKRKPTRLHKFIIEIPKGSVCDHINRNKLDNCKENLRICNNAENVRNSGLSKNNSSGFKGVSFIKRTRKWETRIRYDNKNFYLGSFSSPLEGAKRYNEAAKEKFGKFANLNKI